jgi:hypothetical protein
MVTSEDYRQTNAVRPSSMMPELAAQELLRRVEATADLMALTEYTFDRYRTAPQHWLTAEQLERVERGEIDRLMQLLPPPLAQRCAQLAIACSAPSVAGALTTFVLDYLAPSGAEQQQQHQTQVDPAAGFGD